MPGVAAAYSVVRRAKARPSGSAYVAGYMQSSDFPTSSALQVRNKAQGGSANAFVTKFNAAGSALIFSTYLGGSNNDEANAIAVDGSGNTYIAGFAYSDDFPISDPLQAMNNGAAHAAPNAFIAVLNAAGSALSFSTYLGGSGSLSDGMGLDQRVSGRCGHAVPKTS